LKALKKLLPPSLRRNLVLAARYLGGCCVDIGYWILKENDDLTPPLRMNFVGGGNFRAIGFEFLRYFTEFGGLKRTDNVLDVGCGMGRMALPLLSFLNKGSYEGIDIVPRGIEWCQNKITPTYNNFHFHLSDIYHNTYNPKGKIKAAEYKFPFDNEQFNFVFLTSVFTHMFSADVDHYLSEISRVLKKNGHLFCTWFIMNQESKGLISKGKSTLKINSRIDADKNILVANIQYPEDVVGFDEEQVYSLHKKHGLEIQPPIQFGNWCGRTDFVSFQDIITAIKRN
jgi:SAM-dependent methyltransferase